MLQKVEFTHKRAIEPLLGSGVHYYLGADSTSKGVITNITP